MLSLAYGISTATGGFSNHLIRGRDWEPWTILGWPAEWIPRTAKNRSADRYSVSPIRFTSVAHEESTVSILDFRYSTYEGLISSRP
jgi:hypothetical protein